MKSKMIQRMNDPCAKWRKQLETAYDAGNEEMMREMSRKIDEYQKLMWKEEGKTKKISM